MSKKSVNEIESTEIQEYLNTLKNYSESTIKKITGLLKQGFNYSLGKGYILKNPMVDVIRPKSNKQTKEVRALEVEEQQMFTNYLLQSVRADEPFKVAYLIQMYLGLRIGEVLALRNSDINLHKNLVKITKTLTIDKKSRVIMGDVTKTYAGTREVPIPEFIRNEIIEQMKIAENNRDNLLFVDTKGGYMSPKNANRLLKKTLNQMGILDVSTHSLRHTYGTRCIEAGMRAVALQRLMGHKDISVTLNTYASVFNKYKENELEKVNKYYMNNDIINSQSLNSNNLITDNNYFDTRRNVLRELLKKQEDLFNQGLIDISQYESNLKVLAKMEKKQVNNEEFEGHDILVYIEFAMEQAIEKNLKNRQERGGYERDD